MNRMATKFIALTSETDFYQILPHLLLLPAFFPVNFGLAQHVLFLHSPFTRQPIKIPSSGAQAFLIYHLQGERAITHHAGQLMLTTANTAAGTNGLTCLLKHGEARNIKILVTHKMIDQCCLASTTVRQAH
jgi:hypothetical protein